ncbi:MAG TPA: hypothetical protein VD707_08515 [Gemmatimonadales bacterium]|jgi:hypothetical protein|nr:hypothetical protein [Gemmatimonadales bacterium]
MGEDLIGLVAVTLLFGGGTLFLLSISPVGKAVAARILGRQSVPVDEDEFKEDLKAIRAELEDLRTLRADVTELAERVDFAERLLAKGGRE